MSFLLPIPNGSRLLFPIKIGIVISAKTTSPTAAIWSTPTRKFAITFNADATKKSINAETTPFHSSSLTRRRVYFVLPHTRQSIVLQTIKQSWGCPRGGLGADGAVHDPEGAWGRPADFPRRHLRAVEKRHCPSVHSLPHEMHLYQAR